MSNGTQETSLSASRPRAWVFVLAWLLVLALLVWFPFIIKMAQPGGMIPDPIIQSIATLSLIWSAIMFFAWVWIGDGSPEHRMNFANYKPIWFWFVFVLLLVIITSYRTYSGVESRVNALRGMTSLLNSTISDPLNPNNNARYWIESGKERSRELYKTLINAESGAGIDDMKLNADMRELRGFALSSKQYASQIHSLTLGLVEQERRLQQDGRLAKGTTLEPLIPIVTELKSTSERIDDISADLAAALGASQAENSADTSPAISKTIELINEYYQAEGLIRNAETVMVAGQVNIFAPFILVTTLFSIFLLFPWLLLFLFIFRTQKSLLYEKAESLENLHLDTEVLKQSPRPEARSAAETTSGRKELVEEIRYQTSGNIEYVVSLLLFSGITAILWYFFFYPHASAGLAQLISGGGGVKAFADYIVAEAKPFTFGFIGAYFFVTQMFLRRYFAGDLTAKVYTYAVVRLITVFVLSMVLQLGLLHSETTSNVASVMAFVFGIFPTSGLRKISRLVNKIEDKLVPEHFDPLPLTRLDGLNAWHEARLLEEKIENVQNLATASLNDLIIHTNFSSLQLVDWVDQALLLIHTQERWKDAFQAVGVRTATDLLDNTGELEDPRFDEKATKLAIAINAAQAIHLSDPEHPGEVARLAAAQVYQFVTTTAKKAKELQDIAEPMTTDNSETLDVITALRTKLESLVQAGIDIKEKTLGEVKQAAEALPVDTSQLVKQSKAAALEVEKAAVAISAEVDAMIPAVSQLDRKKRETLTQLFDLRQRLNNLCSKTTNLRVQLASGIKIAENGAREMTSQTEWNSLLTALKSGEEATANVLSESQQIREAMALVDKDKVETFNRIVALQAQINHLYDASVETQAKIKGAAITAEKLQAPPALLTEVHKSLDLANKSTENLVTIVTETKDAATALDIDASATLSGLSAVKESIAKISTVSEEVKRNGQVAALALQMSATPPQLTPDILRTMVTTIVRGPNIRNIQMFWEEQAKSVSA